MRVPEERKGDYMAQIAANKLGARRLQELFTKWTREQVSEGCTGIIEAVTRRMRAGIADLPDGKYEFTDVLDDDGMGTTNIPICVKIDIQSDEIWLNFEGSASQVTGNMNNSFAGLQASVLFALKVLIDPDGPTNHGMLDPVHIDAPEASVVNASFPAATAARAQTCQRIIDVILGALAPAVPERVIAACNGANGVATFSGEGPDGQYYLYMETIGGGAGGDRTRTVQMAYRYMSQTRQIYLLKHLKTSIHCWLKDTNSLRIQVVQGSGEAVWDFDEFIGAWAIP